MASNAMTWRLRFDGGCHAAAEVCCHRTSTSERASDDGLAETRYQAGDFGKSGPAAFVQRGSKFRNCPEKASCVWVHWARKDFVYGRFLNFSSGIHHHHSLRHFCNHAKIMGNEHDRGA